MDDTTVNQNEFKIMFNRDGLIPAIIQDVHTLEVLMLGYMNQDALERTRKGPHVWFYSRSKERLWMKGETSGHTLTVKEVRLDCDQDAVLILCEPSICTCHEGYKSCFYTTWQNEEFTINQKKLI